MSSATAQFEASLAAEVTKDAYKFDSMLIYVLGFFFGMLGSFGLITVAVSFYMLFESFSTMMALGIMFLGIGMGALSVLGSFAVWQRVWLFLLKIALGLIGLSLLIFIFVCVAFVISQDFKSPTSTFADENWDTEYNIKKTELEQNPITGDVAFCKYGGAKTTEGNADYNNLKLAKLCKYGMTRECDAECKKEWVKLADQASEPMGIVFYVLFAVLLVAVFINNEVMEDDSVSATLKHKVAYGINGLLFLLGLILLLVAYNVAGDSSASGSSGIVLGLLLLGTSAAAFAGVYTDMDLFIRACNLAMIVLGMVCLLLGILISLYTGSLGSMKEYYDDNWPSIKAGIDEANENFCVDISGADCKRRVMKKASKFMGIVALAGGAIEAFLFVLIYLSIRGVRFWRSTGEREDIDWTASDDDDDASSYVESSNPLYPQDGDDED